jgi:hypothetical protein
MAIKPVSEDDASTWAAGMRHPAPQPRADPRKGISHDSPLEPPCRPLHGVCLSITVYRTLLCAVGNTFAAVVGDQIELKATHQAGVPLHQEPRGTNDFQRVPDGTRATVIEVAPDGRWVKLSLVWSKNSCGFMRVVFQEPPEPFSTVN